MHGSTQVHSQEPMGSWGFLTEHIGQVTHRSEDASEPQKLHQKVFTQQGLWPSHSHIDGAPSPGLILPMHPGCFSSPV